VDLRGIAQVVHGGVVGEATPVGNGPIFTGPASALPGYVAPRPQIKYPNGTVVYLDATSSASTTPSVAQSTTTMATASSTPSIATPQPLPQSATSSSLSLPLNRQLWDTGADILALQKFLNTHGFTVSAIDGGSPGNETITFGPHTYAALVNFQQANNLPATGFLGPLTRAALAATSAPTR
jgi:peptidoglycan hydrolase-like protein with peptidoglycan-binding domain